MEFVRVAALGDLPPGSVMQFERGDGALAICNLDGTLYALDGICPHAGGPLGHGALHGHMLVCPYHLWEFDCRTGAYDFDENLKQATYPVKVEQGQILVQIA